MHVGGAESPERVLELAQTMADWILGPKVNPLRLAGSPQAELDVHVRRINDEGWGVALRTGSQLHWLTKAGLWGSASEPLSFVDDGSR